MKVNQYVRAFFLCLGLVTYFHISSSYLSASNCYKDNVCYKDNAPAIYAQLSSLENQFNDEEHTINFERVDAISGLEIISHDQLNVRQAGAYFITVNVQIGSLGISPPGDVNLWLIHNGKNVTSSQITQHIGINKSPELSNLTLQSILPFHRGDTISIGYSSTSPSIGLISNTSPSATLSVFRIK